MFDFDASKLLIIGVIALIVIGPKDLPRVLRQAGQMMGKLRRMAGEFQGQFMEAMKEADLQDLRDEVSKLKSTASLDTDFNPMRDIRAGLTDAVGSVSQPSKGSVETADAGPESLSGPSPIADRDAAAAAPEPAGPAMGGATLDHIQLSLAEPAHHTPAASAGAVDAIEPSQPLPDGAVRRRRVVIPKRRAPGDRTVSAAPTPMPAGRGRTYFPPRRDPRP